MEAERSLIIKVQPNITIWAVTSPLCRGGVATFRTALSHPQTSIDADMAFTTRQNIRSFGGG